MKSYQYVLFLNVYKLETVAHFSAIAILETSAQSVCYR
ncbi:hypothetical protein LLB_1094 [Legionella longbeachae D-4968]|nr:hypothetical protein LLB_1094 [Legionella longbeachae D-4968]